MRILLYELRKLWNWRILSLIHLKFPNHAVNLISGKHLRYGAERMWKRRYKTVRFEIDNINFKNKIITKG